MAAGPFAMPSMIKRPGRSRCHAPGHDPNRRAAFAGVAATLGSLSAWPLSLRAQGAGLTYPQPDRVIRIVLGLAPGTLLDSQVRAIAAKAAEQTEVSVQVENVPGNGHVDSAVVVGRSEPDGYTLLYLSATELTPHPVTRSGLAHGALKAFTPITLATRDALVLATHPSVPATNVRELVAWARERPGRLAFGSGPGSSSQLYAEAFAAAAGIEVSHVSFQRVDEAARELGKGKKVQALFVTAASAMADARNGRLRLLGIAAAARSPFLPEVATLDEQGVAGFDLASFNTILGPPGMEPRRVAMVNEVFVRALSTQSVVDSIAAAGYEATPTTPAQAESEIRRAYDRWGELAERLELRK